MKYSNKFFKIEQGKDPTIILSFIVILQILVNLRDY